MSLMDNIRGKPGPKPLPPLQAPEIEQRLYHAQVRVSELCAQRRGTALDAETGDTSAAAQLENLNREIAAANDRVATLRAAHEAAVERDEATLRAQRAALQKTQLAAVRKHLEARNAAAVALTGALEEAAKQYRILLERSDKAQAACARIVSRSRPAASNGRTNFRATTAKRAPSSKPMTTF
jgi:hypothetical protein